MFKRMLQAVGIGGPSVDTVLHNDSCEPGGLLSGEVQVGGASNETEIQRIVLHLVAEVEAGDDQRAALAFQDVTVSDEFTLAAEETRTIPFSMRLPWETPITSLWGETLRGMRLGLRTEVAVAKAVDTSDMDPVSVEPLRSQRAVVEAFLGMGARVKHADVEHGRIRGIKQEFPFYQEIEFFPPEQFVGRVGEIELTLIARSDSLDVVLEADKRGGMFTPGGDAVGRIHRSHEDALTTDWTAQITEWLEGVAARVPGSVHGKSHGHHGHGMGGVAAAGAAGVLGGMALGEMFDDEGMGGMGDMGDMGGGEE